LYLAYLDYMKRFASAGLSFCYPEVSTESKQIFARDAFDLALANTLVPKGAPVVCNDFALDGAERIFVVTGPNQGGKTTFARMFGQLPYLASLGFPVPGREARLFLPDQIFTHFEREEDIANLRGKLEDELVRIHDILRQATSDSIVIMNESFGSTTLNDSLLLGTAVMKQLIARDLLCVYVTFVDELASLAPSSVSLMSTVVPDNPATRTFKVVRQPANGLAYAAAIADKYGLTYETLRRRIAP
jgi:DNA mismatch repair protein MutS